MAFPNWAGNTRFIGPTGPAGQNGTSAGLVLYLDSPTSTTVPTLGSIVATPVTTTGTTINYSASSSTVLLANFPSAVGLLSSLFIPAGLWDFNIYLQTTATTNQPSFYFSLYEVDSDGLSNPILIADGSGEPVAIFNVAPAQEQYVFPLFVPSWTLANSTKRIQARLYGVYDTGGRHIIAEFRDSKYDHIHTTLAAQQGATGPTGPTGLYNTNWSPYAATTPVNLSNYAVDNATTISGTSTLTTTAPAIVSTADGTNNLAAETFNLITAKNGYRGHIIMSAEPGLGNGINGKIDIAASGGTLAGVILGGEININALTPPFVTTPALPSALKMSAFGVSMNAGLTTPLFALPGYNVISALNGVQIISGIYGGSLPSLAGANFLFGVSALGGAGTRVQNGLAADVLTPLAPGNLAIQGNTGSGTISISNLTSIAGDSGNAIGVNAALNLGGNDIRNVLNIYNSNSNMNIVTGTGYNINLTSGSAVNLTGNVGITGGSLYMNNNSIQQLVSMYASSSAGSNFDFYGGGTGHYFTLHNGAGYFQISSGEDVYIAGSNSVYIQSPMYLTSNLIMNNNDITYIRNLYVGGFVQTSNIQSSATVDLTLQANSANLNLTASGYNININASNMNFNANKITELNYITNTTCGFNVGTAAGYNVTLAAGGSLNLSAGASYSINTSSNNVVSTYGQLLNFSNISNAAGTGTISGYTLTDGGSGSIAGYSTISNASGVRIEATDNFIQLDAYGDQIIQGTGDMYLTSTANNVFITGANSNYFHLCNDGSFFQSASSTSGIQTTAGTLSVSGYDGLTLFSSSNIQINTPTGITVMTPNIVSGGYINAPSFEAATGYATPVTFPFYVYPYATNLTTSNLTLVTVGSIFNWEFNIATGSSNVPATTGSYNVDIEAIVPVWRDDGSNTPYPTLYDYTRWALAVYNDSNIVSSNNIAYAQGVIGNVSDSYGQAQASNTAGGSPYGVAMRFKTTFNSITLGAGQELWFQVTFLAVDGSNLPNVGNFNYLATRVA